MNVLVRKPGAFGGLLTGSPEYLGGDRITCGLPSVAGKQPVGGLAPQPVPLDAQCIEQLGAEHDIAVLASFAAADMSALSRYLELFFLTLGHPFPSARWHWFVRDRSDLSFGDALSNRIVRAHCFITVVA